MAVTLDQNSGSILVNGQPFSTTSSMYQGNNTLADFQSHWLGELLTGTASRDYREWLRQEQSADSELYRELLRASYDNEFNAQQAALGRQHESAENQANREWQENLYRNALSIKMEDAKRAGLNPVFALGASTGSIPSGGSGGGQFASASSATSHGTNYTANHNQTSGIIVAALIGALAKIASGFVGGSSGTSASPFFRNYPK